MRAVPALEKGCRLPKRLVPSAAMSPVIERWSGNLSVPPGLFSLGSSDGRSIHVQHALNFNWFDKVIALFGILKNRLGIAGP